MAGAENPGGLVFTQPIQNSTALYGTPGGIFGLLVFLYATMWSLLIGAELSSVLIRWPKLTGALRATWTSVNRSSRCRPASSMLACDFCAVDTVLLRRLDVVFSIELGTRRVCMTGITVNPVSRVGGQPART